MTARGITLAILLSLPSASLVAGELSHNDALRLTQQGIIKPVTELVQIATRNYPESHVLELELEKKKNLYIYEMDVITQTGQVREIKLNAVTGQIIKDELDD